MGVVPESERSMDLLVLELSAGLEVEGAGEPTSLDRAKYAGAEFDPVAIDAECAGGVDDLVVFPRRQ